MTGRGDGERFDPAREARIAEMSRRGVVKVRLPGTPQDIAAVAGRLAEADDITVLDQLGGYPNRRDPGMRVYLTVLVDGTRP